MTFLLQSQRNLCLLLVSNLQVFSDCANHCITEPHCLWIKVLNLIPHSDSFFSVPHWNSLALHVTKMINRLPDMVFCSLRTQSFLHCRPHSHTHLYKFHSIIFKSFWPITNNPVFVMGAIWDSGSLACRVDQSGTENECWFRILADSLVWIMLWSDEN